MKKIVWILVIIAMMGGCKERRHPLIKEVAEIVHQRPDSAQLRPKRWREWEHTYASLTTSQYVFLILQDDLRYDDDTIAKMLAVKPASLRTLRSRIKGRER